MTFLPVITFMTIIWFR